MLITVPAYNNAHYFLSLSIKIWSIFKSLYSFFHLPLHFQAYLWTYLVEHIPKQSYSFFWRFVKNNLIADCELNMCHVLLLTGLHTRSIASKRE